MNKKILVLLLVLIAVFSIVGFAATRDRVAPGAPQNLRIISVEKGGK